MVCVGIDVAKDKHDCCILDSDGTIRADCITIPAPACTVQLSPAASRVSVLQGTA